MKSTGLANQLQHGKPVKVTQSTKAAPNPSFSKISLKKTGTNPDEKKKETIANIQDTISYNPS